MFNKLITDVGFYLILLNNSALKLEYFVQFNGK